MNSNPQSIAIADFDYPLPDDRIAKFPLERRDQSKLLVYRGGNIEESRFDHVPELLPPDTLLIFNNTKVIHARLFFRKPTGSTIEVFCLEPFQMPVALSFEQRGHCTWNCFIGNNKKWKEGSLTRQLDIHGQSVTLTATRRKAVGNAWIVDFDWDGGLSFAELIDQAGVIPLPPYLHREAVSSDNERYQTVYALHQGSVAAPTSTPTIGEHEMHVEKIEISRSNIECILNHLGHTVIPVGTTTVRTIESVYWFGVKLSRNAKLDAMHVMQWDPYELESLSVSTEHAYKNVLQWMEEQGIEQLEGDTQLMIAPGYRYHVISGLITNFHQPKSTLLLLVSALVGDAWKECYRYALDHQFRFLSYGDSCLFLP